MASRGSTILPISSVPAPGLSDAFGRVRTAGTGNRADVEFAFDLNADVCTTITGGAGTVTYDKIGRAAVIKTNGTTTDDFARHVLRYHAPYTPGNSQLIDITGTLNVGNLTGTAGVFIRNNGEDTVIAQADWHNLPDDIDWTKSQIFVMDFQSLRVGIVRFLLNRNGQSVLLHQVNNDNVRTAGYWQYPQQPLNWGIRTTATESVAEIGYFDAHNGIGFRFAAPKSAAAEMRAICGTVKSEGGVELNALPGVQRAQSVADAGVTVSDTLIPLISVRAKTLINTDVVNRGLVFVRSVLAGSAANDMVAKVYKNATLTGATFAHDPGAAAISEFDTAATAITGGELVDTFLVPGSTQSPASVAASVRVPLSVNYAGDSSDTITIAAIRFGAGNATGWAGIVVSEVK